MMIAFSGLRAGDVAGVGRQAGSDDQLLASRFVEVHREINENLGKADGAAFSNLSLVSFSTGTSLSSSDFLSGLFFFMVLLKQFEQAVAHDHARPVRWHVLFDLPAHVHDRVGIG
jgi:hypothetical protein